MRISNSSCSNSARRGIAAVEMVVCLPVLILIVLATIEACQMIYVQQSIKIAAYEGARIALMPGVESGNVQAACEQILSDRKIQGATITVDPNDIKGVDFGEYIRVTVTVPCDQNNYLPSWFYGGKNLTGSVEMMKEN